ncbi:DUF4153 domain-containing protein [Paraglaciecola aquimarina]|uniref:DUF4153 domain-containing protein n=1 Tax=Paraglaciecola aquimarina TaxID=1235557 RepID=A0ABU3SVY6_9ALTE|nr:DUF4153 domain-containing protein [Paraglaciecola aquimarina]MDU0354143.1 DUF4153 domain-containing protein [Paraglaciecola aquimarina]
MSKAFLDLPEADNMTNSGSVAQMSKANEDLQIPRLYIAITALIQGITLAYLYQSVEQQVWPGTNLTWLIALVTFFIGFPSLFLLIASRHDYQGIIKGLLPFSVLISALGAYIGDQQSAFPDLDSTLFVFTLASLIACFKAIMYIKLIVNKQAIHYESLFLASWRNAVIFIVTVIFTSVFFGILHLGAALFDLLGIELFTLLLREEWFWLPSLTFAAAFSIHIFRKIGYLADNISTILQTLLKFLLPLLIFISIGFLLTLPFTGLDNLWKTRSGSFLLLWLITLSLFFVNAIYHKGNDNKPYHFVLHRFILVGVAILPVYSAISLYGILSRVAQYGFTPDRLWALSVWFILSCFVLGYLFGIIRLRDNWLIIQSKVNVVMGLVVLAFVLLVNSPVLNFKAISSYSQMARYYNGDVSIEDLDLRYFSRELGKPGYIAMQQLKSEITDAHPEIVANIDKQYRYVQQSIHRKHNKNIGKHTADITATYWPNEQAFDRDLITYLADDENYNSNRVSEEFRLAIDLNQDNKAEMLTIIDRGGYFQGRIWTKTDTGWNSKMIRLHVPKNRNFQYSLDNTEIQLIEPPYKILNLNGIRIDVNDINAEIPQTEHP